jgi:chromate transporter
MLINMALAWFYVGWGALPQAQPVLRSIGAVIVAVVAAATLRFARTAIKGAVWAAVALLAALAAFAAWRFARLQPEIPVLFAAALFGALRGRGRPKGARTLAVALPALFWTDLGRMAWGLLKIGATLFGTGYVLISYLQSELVDQRGWLTQRQLVDTIAAGQFTPGPLLTSATFVGYVLGAGTFGGGVAGGMIGAVTATAAIFLPSFVVVAIFGPMLQRVRTLGWARGALDSMNAAVVGLTAVAAVRLGISALTLAGPTRPDLLNLVIFACAALGLWARINATWLILAAALLGAAASMAAAGML